jgi:hypothetical protein
MLTFKRAGSLALHLQWGAGVPIQGLASHRFLMTRSKLTSSQQRRFWWVVVLFSPVLYLLRLARGIGRAAKALVPTLSSMWYYYAPASCRHAVALLRTPRDAYFSFWKRLLRP